MRKLFVSLMFFCGIVFPQNDYWEVHDVMPYPVAGASAVVVGEDIYILGGFLKDTQEPTDLIQKYNPLFGEWSIVGQMNYARYGLAADNYNNSIYFYGGVRDTSMYRYNIELFNSLDLYPADIADSNITYNRINSTGLILGDLFYIFGGTQPNPEDSTELAYLTVFNLQESSIEYELDSLYSGFDLPHQQMSAAFGGEIFIFGGVLNGVQNKIYNYNPAHRNYEKMKFDLIIPRAGGDAVYSSYRNSILLIGGFHETRSALRSTEIFSRVDTNYYSMEGPRLNYARNYPAAAVCNDGIYVFGGFDENGEVVKYVELLRDEALTNINDDHSTPAVKFELLQNYPNPFNPGTIITFNLKTDQHVKLNVYSIFGEEVITLINDNLSSGYNKVNWDGKDKFGRNMSSGVYIYSLNVNGNLISKKMTLLR